MAITHGRLRRGVTAYALGLGLALAAGDAGAQGIPIWQSGTITQGGAAPNQPAALNRDGRIIPGGGLNGLASSGRGLAPFGVTDGTDAAGVHTPGLGTCWNSGSTSGNYNALCAGHDASGNGLITLDSYGVANASMLFRINGSTYGFPGNGQGNILGPNSSTNGHIMLFNNTLGTLAKDAGNNLGFAVPDLTGAVDNAATLNAQIAASAAAGGQAVVLPAGQVRVDGTVNSPAKTLWLTLPGTYFSGAGGFTGNIDASLFTAAGQTLYGMLGELDFGGATPNQALLVGSAYIPVTSSSAGYQKTTAVFESYSADPSTYAGAAAAGTWPPILIRENVALEGRAWSNVTNGRSFAGHFLITSTAGHASVSTGVNVEVNNNSGSPEGYANQKDSAYALSIDNVGNTLATSAIWVAPGSALFQDGMVFDYLSVNSNYFAVYSGPGTAQVTRFAIQKLGTSGMELTFTGGGGASDVWIAHTDAADTALYFNSPSNLIGKIGGGEVFNASANGLMIDTGLVVGTPVGSFKGGGTINAATYYSQGVVGLSGSLVASGTCTLLFAGGIVTGKTGC